MYIGVVVIVLYGASEAVVCWQVEVAEGKQARQRDRDEKRQAQQAERAAKKAAEKAEKERWGSVVKPHSNAHANNLSTKWKNPVGATNLISMSSKELFFSGTGLLETFQ